MSTQIPIQFRGKWTGQIFDQNRTNPYAGVIEIGIDQVQTHYDLKQGAKIGSLNIQYLDGGFLVLREDVASFHGMLMLYLDANGNLKCVWTRGSQFQCEATMNKQIASHLC